MARRAILVCSPGGHLVQMLALESSWHDFETVWATLPSPDVDHLLAGRQVVLGHGPTNRSVAALVRNFPLAWRVLRHHRPDVVLSTGAGLAVPFFVAGRLLRVRLVYVESLTRTRGLSLSGRIVKPLASAFFVQWPGAAGRGATYAGGNLL